MTEIAADEDAPAPPAPRRGHAPSGASGAGALAASAVGAALLAGAGWFAWGPARLNGALEDLLAADPAIRKAAQESLAARKEAAVARLPELAASPNPLQRRRAVLAAAALDLKDDPAVLELVGKAASDPDPSVREAALACLGGFTNGGSPGALKALLDLCKPSEPALPPGLAEALGEAAPPSEQGRSLLAERGLELLASHPSPKLRSALLRSLGMLLAARTGDPAPEALKLLQGLVASASDPDPEVRSALDAVLRQMQGAKAVPFALAALESPDAWVRLWGESVLREATGKGAGSDPLGPEEARRSASEQWKALAR